MTAPAVAPWIFFQLAGAQKILTLAGNDAPHGRPRQKAIVKDKIVMRQHTIYYSGDGPPTRHVFGPKFDPWELTGRFMDRAGGVDYARKKAEYVRSFVADGQDLTIGWGGHINVRGFIDSFESGIESAGEIAWTMSISVDADNLLDHGRDAPEPSESPSDYTNQIEQLLLEALVPSVKQPPFFKGSLFDVLDSAIALVTAPFAALAQIAGEMSSFEKSLIGSIRRFRSGLHQLQTALIIFRNTYQDLRANLANEGRNIGAELSFSVTQASSAESTLKAMALIVQADRAAARALRGKIKGYYVVKDGDSWESISLYLYQSSDRVDDLRAANGIEPGSPPAPGAVYQVPR